MSGAIASLIADFSAPAATDGFGIGMLRPAKPVPETIQPEPARAPSAQERHAELIHSIEAQVRDEERRLARQQLKDALDAEQERSRKELAAQRELWVEREAAQLAGQVAEAISNLEQGLSDRVARILAPILPEALRRKAMAEFNEALATILSGETSTLMKITGPEDMLNAIEARFAVQTNLIQFVPNDAVEVALLAGDTAIQTQLGSWATRLQEALKTE